MSIVFVDGNNLAFRADAVTTLSAGTFPTSAIFGSLKSLHMIVHLLDRPRIIVVWDGGGETFRHRMYPEYKAHRLRHRDPEEEQRRKDARELLYKQIKVLKKILNTLGIQQIQKTGVEADDIIACATAHYTEHKRIIYSGDRDFVQLVRKNVSLYLPDGTEINDTTNLDDLTPEQYLYRKVLFGDASDNITGIPGIGIKTATRLVKLTNTYDPDMMVSWRAEIQADRYMRNVFHPDARAIAMRNAKLVSLKYGYYQTREEVMPLFDAKRPMPNFAEARQLLAKYQFATFLLSPAWVESFNYISEA